MTLGKLLQIWFWQKHYLASKCVFKDQQYKIAREIITKKELLQKNKIKIWGNVKFNILLRLMQSLILSTLYCMQIKSCLYINYTLQSNELKWTIHQIRWMVVISSKKDWSVVVSLKLTQSTLNLCCILI